MRSQSFLAPALAVMLLGASFPQPAAWPAVTVERHSAGVLGPGVTYDEWRVRSTSGPLAVYVTTVDLRNPLVRLDVATHGGTIVGADEPLSVMADRAHAEAAINADYFDINESGAPLNAVIEGGRILHQPDDAAVLAIAAGNAVTMGPLALHATLTDASGASLQINTVNDWSKNAGLTLVTPEYGAAADADLALVLVPDGSGAAGAYRVSAVEPQSTVPALPAGQLAVVARGAEQVGRLSAFPVNDAVTLRFDGTPDPSTIVAAVGGGPMLLSGGKVAADPAAPAPQETQVRYPVTGAGISADRSTLWLVAVDGRAPDRSVGITRPMLGQLLAALGASDAMAFDSGGSTEMAVRALGDPVVTVANVPSDGKERPIADALLVLNAATPGPAASLVLRAPAAALLVGSHLPVRAAAIDQNMQPATLDASAVRYSSDQPAVATVDAAGIIAGVAPGRTTVRAQAPASASPIEATPMQIDVVASPDALAINGYSRVVETGANARLTVSATMRDGTAVAVDPSAVSWSASGDGRIATDGAFAAGRDPGIAKVTARVGKASAVLDVLVGEHQVTLDPLTFGPGQPMRWQFKPSADDVMGSLDTTAAPDGGASLHLDYSFSAGATRAAYAQTALPVPGEPLALSIDVYGDGNGEWLRGGYRNADGIDDSLTLARHVDWKGWKTLRVAVPAQARWPIVWTRLYVVETRSDAIESGDLWFRSFSGAYAGPPPAQKPS